MNDEFKENAIVNLTFDFALKIIDFCDELDGMRKFALSNQLLKSGTSIGANAREAQNAESKADFIHNLRFQPKKLRKQNIGYYSVCIQINCLIQLIC
jgi:hypothetical protein